MEQKPRKSRTVFSDLPSHIAIEILSRLSSKTVSRCRCVCKQWLGLSFSPEFAKSCQSRTRPALMIFTISNDQLLTAVELEDEPTSHDMYYLHGSPLTDLTEGLTPNNTSMFGTVDGLLSFHEFGWRNPDRILVLNPVTMESITLPTTEGLMQYPNVTSYGFGVTSVSSDLKVVKIYQEKQLVEEEAVITKSECRVYTLGEGRWRLLQEPAPFIYSCRSHGVFFNGYIHWLVDDVNDAERISRFDLEKESFSAFPAPPEFNRRGLATLGVYKGGFLSICDNSSDFETAIWVMEEYGAKESWVKKFVIDKEPWGLAGEGYEVVRLLRVFEDGVILLLWGDYHLFSFNSKTNYLQKIDFQNLTRLPEKYSESIQVVDYVPNFLSLKRFGREIVQG